MKKYIDLDEFLSRIEHEQNKLESNDDNLWEINKNYFKGLSLAKRIAMDMDCIQLGYFENANKNGTYQILREKDN